MTNVRFPRFAGAFVLATLLVGASFQCIRIQRLIREIRVYSDIAQARQQQSNTETGIELVWDMHYLLWKRDKWGEPLPFEVGPYVKAELLKISPGALEAFENMGSLGTDKPWPFYLSSFISSKGPLRPIRPMDIKKLRQRLIEAEAAKGSDDVLRADFIQRTGAFPKVKVVGKFSRVGFDSSKSFAAVGVTWISLLDTGAPFYRGSVYILRLEGDEWRLEKSMMDWVS